MTFFYLTNFSYVKTVLTIWSVSQFAIFKNRHVFADPITYIYIYIHIYIYIYIHGHQPDYITLLACARG